MTARFCQTRAVSAWLARLVDAAALPTDDDITVSRKRLLAGGALFAPGALVTVGLVYIAYDEAFAGWLYIGFALWVWLNLTMFLRVHKNYEKGFWLAAVPVLPVHFLVIASLGDIVHSGAIVLWGLAFPIATGIVFVPMRKLAPLIPIFALNVVVTVLVGPADRSNVPPGPEKAILLGNLVAQSLFALAILGAFVQQRDLAFRLLREEQRRARELLLSILPEAVADELSRSPHVIADHFAAVSVLFADVVDFTPLSSTLTPAELVQVLDELFACFDDLVEQAGVEKIKTIGDCYMVAAGIPRPRDDHADALVTLALDMQKAVATRDFRGHRLRLRIGVNSGPVIAGVIGRRKFSYDLWGDVVNTASRMESHGLADAVQVTASTYELVREHFECEPRGVVDVKGKGALPTWLVHGPVPRRPRPPREDDGRKSRDVVGTSL